MEYEIKLEKLRTMHDIRTLIEALNLTIDESHINFSQLMPYLEEKK